MHTEILASKICWTINNSASHWPILSRYGVRKDFVSKLKRLASKTDASLRNWLPVKTGLDEMPDTIQMLHFGASKRAGVKNRCQISQFLTSCKIYGRVCKMSCRSDFLRVQPETNLWHTFDGEIRETRPKHCSQKDQKVGLLASKY